MVQDQDKAPCEEQKVCAKLEDAEDKIDFKEITVSQVF